MSHQSKAPVTKLARGVRWAQACRWVFRHFNLANSTRGIPITRRIVPLAGSGVKVELWDVPDQGSTIFVRSTVRVGFAVMPIRVPPSSLEVIGICKYQPETGGLLPNQREH